MLVGNSFGYRLEKLFPNISERNLPIFGFDEDYRESIVVTVPPEIINPKSTFFLSKEKFTDLIGKVADDSGCVVGYIEYDRNDKDRPLTVHFDPEDWV